MRTRQYKESLRGLARASAGPYGYTLTLWSSGAVAIERLGHPRLVGVLLLALGGVAGFVAIEILASGIAGETPAQQSEVLWVNAHLLANGGAVIAVWAATGIVTGRLGWLATGFLATSVYLSVGAAQATAAAKTAKQRVG